MLRSVVYYRAVCIRERTVWMRFLVVCGLFDVIAIFCPIRWFINVDFPTFGLPMIVTNPDLNFSFINFLSLYLFTQTIVNSQSSF